MLSKVICANGTFWYSGFAYKEVRVPGGTLAQPSLLATSSRYSLEVAHCTKLLAASAFSVPAGIAKDHAHNQLPRLPRPLSGANAKPTLSATLESLGLVTKEAATVASIHMPHLPCWNNARFSLKPLEEAPGGP